MSTRVERFTVLETRDINETAEVIEKIDRYIRSAQDQEDFHIMSYSSFMEKGSKNRALSVNRILFYMFLLIKGLTENKARLLSDYFKSSVNLFQMVKSNEFQSILESKFLNEEIISKKDHQELMEFFSK